MSLMRCYYDPITEFDRLFDDASAARLQPHRDPLHPRMDVRESNAANTVTATFELPGMGPDDITIDVRRDRLAVAGEAKDARSHEEGGYAVRERVYGKFSRTLQLPFGTKPDDVIAKMENGVLTVTFPRTTPEQRAQRIPIQ